MKFTIGHLLFAGWVWCLPQVSAGADPVPATGSAQDANPTEGALYLAKKITVLSDLAGKLMETDPGRAAALLPEWKVQLTTSKTFAATLQQIVDKNTAYSEQLKKKLNSLPAGKRALQQKFLARLEIELDTTQNRCSIVAEATAGLEKQLTLVEEDPVVSTLVQSRQVSETVNSKLKFLSETLLELQGGSTKPVDREKE